MVPNLTGLRIGIVDQTASGWVAASIYSRMILRSLEAAAFNAPAVELYFLGAQGNDDHLPGPHRATPMHLTNVDYIPGERQLRRLLRLNEKSRAWPGESRLRKALRLTSQSDVFSLARQNRIDVLLPLLDLPPWRIDTRTIGWIPDFQHVHLPEFFSQRDLDQRNATYQRLAERASVVMLSSRAAQDDFAGFVPAHAHKSRAIPFPSLLVFDTLADNPIATRTKFNLPEKFAMVANQFWAHKNHALVVRALELLRTRGINIPVVMTGLPADHRDPANKNFSSLLQAIASAGLHQQIIILGLVPYADLVNLMRTATLIIQPSRFEGWSTVVQDAVALGRPLLCSDIAVHREQAPNALGFFATDDAELLAELLASHWQQLTPGPDPELENRSLASEQNTAARHGQSLLSLCREVAAA